MSVCRQKTGEPGFNCSLPPIGGQSRIAQAAAQVLQAATVMRSHMNTCPVESVSPMSGSERAVALWGFKRKLDAGRHCRHNPSLSA